MSKVSIKIISAFLLYIVFAFSGYTYDRETKVVDIPEIDNIKIDGKSEDWGDNGFKVEAIPMKGCGLKSPSDFDAEFRLAWNKDGLLILLKVKDDIGYEHDKIVSLYRNDCVEIFMADKRNGTNMVQMLIAPGKDPRFQKMRYKVGDLRKDATLRKDSPKVNIANKHTAEGYQLEIMLSWENLAIKPVLGSECGLNIYIDERDVPNGEKTVAQWYPQNYAVINTSAMHALKLAEKPSLPQKVAGLMYHSPVANNLVVGRLFGVKELAGKTFEVKGKKLIGKGKFILRDNRAIGEFKTSNYMLSRMEKNDIIQIFVDGKEVGTIDYVLKPPAEFSSDNKNFGSKIPRTMKKLATSTPGHRKKVKILFYGQSITDQVWWWETVRVLKARFPYADIEVMNPAIGGYTVPKLLRTGEHDIYPYYPDLIIFHAYDSKGGNIEQMVKNIRSRTSAEIILWTHHANTRRSANKPDNLEIRKTAKDYGCELVDVEEAWIDYLLANNLRRTDLLRDGIHLNQYGCRLLAQLISRHFQYIPEAENRWSESISRLIPKPDENGMIKIDFTGNRVDLISGAAPEGTKLGSARILIDGKKPSSFPELYQFSRSSIGLCVVRPAIHRISNKNPLIVEDWRIEITDVKFSKKEGKQDILIEFELIGSKTGKDGKGNNQKLFVSNSGRVVIEPQDWNLMPYSPASVKAQKLKDIDISWRVIPFFKDTFQAKEIKDPASEEITIIAQGLENGKHTLEIIPNGDGLVPIKEILIHKPPINNTNK